MPPSFFRRYQSANPNLHDSLGCPVMCRKRSTSKSKDKNYTLFLSSKSWLREPPVQGCTGGVWGGLDGRYQTGAEMASRIKVRECRDHALVVSARTPSSVYPVKLDMDRRAEYHTVVPYTSGIKILHRNGIHKPVALTLTITLPAGSNPTEWLPQSHRAPLLGRE